MKPSSTRAAFPDVRVHALSALNDATLDALGGYLAEARTSVLLGSSGVGKSTLVNRLVGEEVQRSGHVREADRRGRHTTSARQMFLLPSGGLLIDTPGLRELRLWDAGAGFDRTFADLEALSARCRFRNCLHRDEPGCAIHEALQDGSLDRTRFDNYLKLQKEEEYRRRRDDPEASGRTKRRWKAATKEMRLQYKFKDDAQ